MPQTTENAPRSCRGAGTLLDHAAARELTAISGEAAPTAGTEPGSLRKNRTVSLRGTGPCRAGLFRHRRGELSLRGVFSVNSTENSPLSEKSPRELRESLPADPPEPDLPRSRVTRQPPEHRQCSVIMPAAMITETSPADPRQTITPPGTTRTTRLHCLKFTPPAPTSKANRISNGGWSRRLRTRAGRADSRATRRVRKPPRSWPG